MKNTWWQKIILTIFCAGLLVSPLAVQAQLVTTDPSNLGNNIAEFVYNLGKMFKKGAGAVVFKNMLTAYLSNAAYDAAVFVSSAGSGQKPLIHTQPWNEYYLDVGIGAVSDGLNQLISEAGFQNFNVCSPPTDLLKINIALGLQTSLITPEQPSCTLSELGDNWAEAVTVDEFQDVFELSFDPAENEIGTFLTLQSALGEQSFKEEEAAKLKRIDEGPIASKTGAISQYIQTPGSMISNQFLSTVNEANEPQSTYTGEVVADTLNIFSSTLFSKLTERLRNGFITAKTTSGTSLSGLISGQTGGTTGGVAAAKATYNTLNQPTFNPGGEIDSSYQLVQDGIIDQTFQLAIENQWQTQELIDYLNDNVEGGANSYLFGVSSDEISSPLAGITRRGIYLLKKYGIVPVGWQIAADLIYGQRQNGDFTGVSLGDLADCNDGDCLFNNCGIDNDYSEFCKLVDPDWVLKSPQAYCAKESYGLTTVYDDFLDQDGNEYNQEEHVLTREQTCVDEMTCINEDSEGNCYDYGYCIKDKRTYQFEGEGCSEEVASCQTYERQSDEEEVSYLTNTLNYGECNDDDALGCNWYCQNEGSVEGNWGCTSLTESYTECSEATGTEEGYCYCSEQKTCEVDIYDSSCEVDTGDTCSLSEVCSPENENYIGANCTDYDSCCECTLTDSAYMGVEYYVVDTDSYGWECNLEDAGKCTTEHDAYFTYISCDSLTCADNCEMYEGDYSCTNDGGEECYIEISENAPEDLATVYLNSQVEECDSDNNGCVEFIPARENNLLFNSSFEDYDTIDNDNDLGVCSDLGLLDPLASPYCSSDTYCNGGTCVGWNNSGFIVTTNDSAGIDETSYGSAFIYLNGSSGTLTQSIDYDDYVLADRSFVISLQSYSTTSCSLTGNLSGVAFTFDLTDDGIWTSHTSDPITFSDSETATELVLTIDNSCVAYIDAVQLEENDEASSYYDYGTVSQAYLNEDRDECQSSEVGCQLYTPTSGKFREEVPGIITNYLADACTGTDGFADPDCSQCDEDYVGCDFYQEQPLNQTIPLGAQTASPVLGVIGATTGTQARLAINDRTGQYCSGDQSISCYSTADCGGSGTCLDMISLVPSTATSCPADAVGCESYTNLGTVAEGGEGTEYYNYLKQCVTTADDEIDTYYSWEGSDESGYQLKSTLLKKASDDSPCTNLDLTVEDFNADCTDGGVTTANDCTAEYGTDPDCILYYNSDGAEFYRYESEVIIVSDECLPLRNDEDGRAYYILQDESTECSAEEVGCREYKGSEGADVKLLINDDFSDCTAGDWLSETDTLDAPSESVYVDDCSLAFAESAYYQLYSTDDDGVIYPYLESGNSYVATFWAKGDGDVTISLDAYAFDETVTLTSDWQEYNVGPLFLEVTTTEEANLTIEHTGTMVYFDSFYLQESESQYLIQGSADLCQGYEGCQTYQDEDRTEYYLKSFAKLCSEEKVGCDIVYNSQNTSSNPYPHRYNQSNEYSEDDLIIGADEIDYLVLGDEDTECSSEEKGCQALGEPDVNEQDGSITNWETTYLINDPDSYDSILCQYQHLRCQEYESPYDGIVYFKDPGDKTCSFNSTDNTWYQTGTSEVCDLFNPNDSPSQPMGSVCDDQSEDLEGEYCQEDSACGDGRCIDTNSDSGWVGICEDEDSGCTQYSDPLTGEELITNYSFEYDEIDNSTGSAYEEDETEDNEPDYWYDLVDHDTADTITQESILTALGLSSISACDNFEMNEDYKHHYSHSLKADPGSSDCVVLSKERVEIDANKTYNLSAWLYNEGAGADVGLLFYNGSENSLVGLENLVINYGEDGTTLGTDWEYYHGTIGYGKSIEFPEGTTEVWPYIKSYYGTSTAYIDEFSLKEEENYYYLDYTIDGTEEGAVSGTTTDECVTGINTDEGCLSFRDNTRPDLSYLANNETCTACSYSNEEDTCSSQANTCDTNTIIKVRPDRVCDQWIDCYYYNEVTSSDGEDSELECLGLGVCQGINDEGDCTDWAALPTSPDGNDDLTYISEADAQSVDKLDEIKDYTSYSKVGMIWPSIKSCVGGYNDDQSCDSDDDCLDWGECNLPAPGDPSPTCEGGSLAGTWCTVTSGGAECHNEAGDGVCAGQFEIQGYYPYAAMVEYGDLDEEMIEDGNFEELYCEGGSKVDTNSPCIIDSHCYNSEIKSYNDSIADGSCIGTCTEIDDGTGYYCPNHYSRSAARQWAFSGWEAEGGASLMVKQYSDDPTYGSDSRFNKLDETYAQDWNNVLEVSPSSDSADGVERTGLDGSIVNGNTYTLSFKAKYSEGFDSDDVLNIGLRHTDSSGTESTDWFAKGQGMVDIVFIFDTVGTAININREKAALIAGLDDIVANMPEDINYRLALVTSNNSGTTLIQDMTTVDVIESAINGLSSVRTTDVTCNFDALYDTINSSSISYRDESQKVIILVTDSGGAEGGSSCTYNYGEYGSSLIDDLISSEDASYYIFARTPYEAPYYLLEASLGFGLYDSGASDYSSDMAEVAIESGEEAEVFQFTNVWTNYTFGPLTIIEKPESFEDISTDLVIYQSSDSSGAAFMIDDVSLLPTLEVNKELDTISRDCRAYPEDTSLSCSYYQGGGNYYRGWMGYCLEYDPEDDNNCLVWWPADRIKGESFISSLRSEAGYSERSPVYNCLVSKGYAEVGFCVDSTDLTYTHPEYGTISGPLVDYDAETDDNLAICGSDSDCGSRQICFKGADMNQSVYIDISGSFRSQWYDARVVNFDSNVSDFVYPTYRDSLVNLYDTGEAISVLETEDYKAVTRRFQAPIVGETYNLADETTTINLGAGGAPRHIAIYRYPANPLERNIHISEVERITLDPGFAGVLHGSTDESGAFSPVGIGEINLTNGQLDWGLSSSSDQIEPGNIDDFCTNYDEGGADGASCYWVRQYQDGNDQSTDIIYTFAFSDWVDDGQTFAECKNSVGLEEALGDTDADGCDGALSAQLPQIIGTADYYNEQDRNYQNPWNHLGVFSGLTDYGDETSGDPISIENIERNFGVSSTSEVIESTEYFILGENTDEDDWFRPYDSHNNGGNVVSVLFDFNDQGYLDNIYALTWFGSMGSGDIVDISTTPWSSVAAPSWEQPMSLTYYLREPCAVIAKSVDDNGDNYAWSSRISDNNYVLPGSLNIYEMFADLEEEPFGAIPPHSTISSTPLDGWDGIDVSETEDLAILENQAPLVMEDGNSFNAGWPISCIGNCGTRVCSDTYEDYCSVDTDCDGEAVCIGVGGLCKDTDGEITSTFCNDGSNCSSGDCQKYQMDEIGFGEGSDYESQVSTVMESAFNRYKYLFAQPLAIYNSSINGNGYDWESIDFDFDDFNENQMPQCPDNQRTVNTDYTSIIDSANEYCGVRPEISEEEGLEINGLTQGEVIVDKSQKITLSFTSEVDSEQLPLEKIYIDWYGADWGADWDGHDWGYGATSHSYSWYSSCSTSSGNYCLGTEYLDGGTCEYDGYCVYKPRVTFVDHWGWASGQDGGDDSRANYEASYSLSDDATYDEFNGLLLVKP